MNTPHPETEPAPRATLLAEDQVPPEIIPAKTPPKPKATKQDATHKGEWWASPVVAERKEGL